jgi:hypothetical protein
MPVAGAKRADLRTHYSTCSSSHDATLPVARAVRWQMKRVLFIVAAVRLFWQCFFILQYRLALAGTPGAQVNYHGWSEYRFP